MFDKFHRAFLALSLAILVSSCAAPGPKFVRLEEAPADKALVYFVRPSAMTASARKVTIAIDKVEYIRLANAGYTIARLDPGWHEFEQSTSYIIGDPKIFSEVRAFRMELRAGETYFVGFHADSAVGIPWRTKTSTMTTITIPMTFQYGFGIVESSRALEALKECNYQEPGK